MKITLSKFVLFRESALPSLQSHVAKHRFCIFCIGKFCTRGNVVNTNFSSHHKHGEEKLLVKQAPFSSICKYAFCPFFSQDSNQVQSYF